MTGTYADQVMALVWRGHPGGPRLHAVEMRRGAIGATEHQRLLPSALCGFTPTSGWGFYNAVVPEVEAKGCPACERLRATWGGRR